LTAAKKKILKDKIITELYNSNILTEKIHGILYRNHIHKDTLIYEDVLQETFFYLSKKSAGEIIDMYYYSRAGKKNENGGCLKRLIGLGVCIAVLKGITKSGKNYPKHSIGQWILFGSNLNQLSYLSPTECSHEDEPSHNNTVLMDPSTETDNFKEMWSLIREQMTPAQEKELEYFLNLKKKTQGRYKNEIKDRRTALLKRIEEIIVQNKINV
jgi:hypothetical protein